MAEQLEVARAHSAACAGRVIRVLVEKEAGPAGLGECAVSSGEHGQIPGRDRGIRNRAGRCVMARGEADAPDIDGRVFVRGRLPLGEFARVRVIGHRDYDLLAEPA